jgi:peptidoglycan/xylan/chitin deacetylase (PgdA/CDA1 family)
MRFRKLGAMIVLGMGLIATGLAARVDVSLDPPGGLAPSNTPQMVLLTFDDAVNPGAYGIVQQMLTNRFNPNGTPIQATFFVSGDWTDYWLVHQLHAQGHEIAIHTLTHTTGTGTSRADWRAEIAGCRRTLARLAGIPRDRIRGFRAPFLAYNADSFGILKEQGMDYDSSITETPGLLSGSIGRMIWPYTLDNGVQQNCWTGQGPDNPVPGLFEIPLWSLYDPATDGFLAMDPAGDQARVVATLKTNFLARLNGNRAPLGIFMHAGQWSDRTVAIREFMDWAQTFPDVWFVSAGTLVDFMNDPHSSTAVGTFPPFVTVPYAAIPEAQSRMFYFDKGGVRTCGEEPSGFPSPNTVYLAKEPFSGGTCSLEVTAEWTSGFGGQLMLSNGTDRTAKQWEASIELPGCAVSWLSGASWRMEGDTLFLSSSEGSLAPGAELILAFGGSRTQEVQVANQVVTFYETTLQKPRFSAIRRAGEGIRLEWDDSAFGYEVCEATGSLSSGWRTVAEVHGATSWTGAVPSASSAVFYKLNAIP